MQERTRLITDHRRYRSADQSPAASNCLSLVEENSVSVSRCLVRHRPGAELLGTNKLEVYGAQAWFGKLLNVR